MDVSDIAYIMDLVKQEMAPLHHDVERATEKLRVLAYKVRNLETRPDHVPGIGKKAEPEPAERKVCPECYAVHAEHPERAVLCETSAEPTWWPEMKRLLKRTWNINCAPWDELTTGTHTLFLAFADAIRAAGQQEGET